MQRETATQGNIRTFVELSSLSFIIPRNAKHAMGTAIQENIKTLVGYPSLSFMVLQFENPTKRKTRNANSETRNAKPQPRKHENFCQAFYTIILVAMVLQSKYPRHVKHAARNRNNTRTRELLSSSPHYQFNGPLVWGRHFGDLPAFYHNVKLSL